MNNLSALSIQETLKSIDVISIPWIQSQYNLTYSQARQFLEQLILRGWAKKEQSGIEFKVQKENLCFRKIERCEINDLMEDMSLNCIYILECVKMKNATGVSIDELKSELRRNNAKEVIEILMEHNLIYCVKDRYFARVSQMTVEVLSRRIFVT